MNKTLSAKSLPSVKVKDKFIYSAAVLLFVTATGIIFAATGATQALRHADPITSLPNRQVCFLMGGLELLASAFLLLKNGGQGVKLNLIAWLATTLFLYRVGRLWMDAPNLGDCLANLNDQIPVSPRINTWVMLAVLAWLLLGSYGLIILDGLGRTRLPAARVGQLPGEPR